MNGKDYVEGAREKAEKLLASMKISETMMNDPGLEAISKACESLEGVKNKPTLKTRPGTNLAFPVYDAAEKMEESWEDGDRDEVKEQIENFVSSVESLKAALKERTVIMT